MARRAIPPPPPTMLNVEEHVFGRASALLTVGADHAAWGGRREELGRVAPGSFVRVFPPEGASDGDVEAVCRALGDGCRVRVMPRERAAATPVLAEASPRRSARDVCLALVEEVVSRDRDALRALAEEIMAEAGI